ncbi:MAG: hypothetical protein ACK5MN_05800 [Lachnospiraceae bacterium]
MEKQYVKRFLLESTLDRYLKEMKTDLHRGLRELASLIEEFANQEHQLLLRQLFEQLLNNEASPYYTALQQLLDTVRPEIIKTIALAGYNCRALGTAGQTDPVSEQTKQQPWCIQFHFDPTADSSLSYAHVEKTVRQGKTHGIYFYVFTGTPTESMFANLVTLLRRNTDCVFLCFLADRALQSGILTQLASCKSTIFCLAVEGNTTPALAENFRKRRLLYGIFHTYRQDTPVQLDELLDSSYLRAYPTPFYFLMADRPGQPSEDSLLSRQLSDWRMAPAYPVFPVDWFSDAQRIAASAHCAASPLLVLTNSRISW